MRWAALQPAAVAAAIVGPFWLVAFISAGAFLALVTFEEPMKLCFVSARSCQVPCHSHWQGRAHLAASLMCDEQRSLLSDLMQPAGLPCHNI